MSAMDYRIYQTRIAAVAPDEFFQTVREELAPELSHAWRQAYCDGCPRAEIVAIDLNGFVYLFDLDTERTIAASGLMGGQNKRPRDRGRMAGFPLSDGRLYHRGHLIPHSGHGGEDINLFAQLGSTNVGPFRNLERRGVANPGSFYFVRLIYQEGVLSQRPAQVEQGLLLNNDPPRLDIRLFAN